MFKKILFSCLLVFISFNVCARKEIVQGPFFLKGETGVSVEFSKNNDNSISLNQIINGDDKTIDNYEVGDGVPAIETVFFYKMQSKNKLVVLVSWDEENISAIHYKINIYDYAGSGVSGKDKCLSTDKNLEGYDGYSGNGMTFDLKNAGEIKRYLHNELSKRDTQCRE